MAQCEAYTKESSFTERCRRNARPGRKYCQIHEVLQVRSRRKKLFRVIGLVAAAISGTIAFFAAIGGILGSFPEIFPTPTKQPPGVLIENLLSFTDQLQSDQSPETVTFFSDSITSLENDCVANRHDVVCWLLLGQLRQVSTQYRAAMEAYVRANELEPRLADPYYAKGNLYFDLALIDLIRKRRFELDTPNLRLLVQPDEATAILFEATMEQYNRGDRYPTIQELNPQLDVLYTAPDIIARRRTLIDQFRDGSTSLEIDGNHLLRPLVWLPAIHGDDEELMSEVTKLMVSVADNLLESPENYPFMYLPWSTEEAIP